MHRGMQLNQKKQKLREKEACGHPHGVYVKSHVETTAVNSRYFYAWKPTLSQVNFYQSIQNSFFFTPWTLLPWSSSTLRHEIGFSAKITSWIVAFKLALHSVPRNHCALVSSTGQEFLKCCANDVGSAMNTFHRFSNEFQRYP